jgi:heme/copper-type cytochrome/quinol oxidase subunit 4
MLLLGLWVLFLGSKYATRRGAVIACAVGAAALGLLQIALLAFLRAWSQGFGGRTNLTTIFELLLAVVLVIGVIVIWVFVRAKLSPRAHRA